MKFAIWFFLPIILIAAIPGAAAPQAAREKLEISEIEALINTIENPEKRKELIAQLKLLVKAAKETQAAKAPQEIEAAQIIERGSANIVRLAQLLVDAVVSLPEKVASVAQKAPSKLSAARAYFYKKQNLLSLVDVLIKLIITIGAGFALLHLLRKYLLRYKRAIEVEDARPTLGKKIALAAFNIGIEASPYIALFVIGFIFSNLLGLSNTASASIYAVLLLIMLWKIVSEVARSLFSPEDRAARLIPLSDELAAYTHRWSAWFVNYGFLAYIPVALVEIAGAPAKYTASIKALYSFAFVVMASAISLQWKDKISARLKISLPGAESKAQLLAVKAWNGLISKLYIFFTIYIVTLFLVWTLGYSQMAKRIVIATIETIVLLLLTAALWLFVSHIFGKLDFLKARAKEKYPGLESKVKGHLAVVQFIVQALIVFFAISLISGIWGLKIYSYLSSGVGGALLKLAISIGTVILLAYIATSVVQFFVQRAVLLKTRGKIEELSKKGKTLIPLIDKAVRYAILSISGLIILQQLGINIGPILAGAGILGLAVGFGAQTLVKDIITGFFILIEDSISVGDVVVIKGTGGLVEAVNLRTVRMRDLAGNVHYIPNSSIEMVTNMTKDYSRYVIDVGVAYKEKVDEVMELIKGVGAEMQSDPKFAPDILEPLEIFGVDDFGESAVIIKMRITTKPLRQWEVGRELRRRIKNAFDAKGIEIPFPHRTLHLVEPKELFAGPISVRIENLEQLLARDARDLNRDSNEKKGSS